MQVRPLGKSGISASVIGLGAWVMGGGSIWAGADDSQSIQAIHAALDGGINLIDTAPAYGFGHGEEVVGRAIKGRRDKVVLATKCGLLWDDERGAFFCPFDGKSLYRSLRPDTIAEELEASLRRLGTDVIDLYQTHWPAVEPVKTPIADTVAALVKLKNQGKVRAIGVSNVSPEELKENCAAGPIASDQFRYSMLHRQPEADILPYCAKHNLATLTYMSLEQGLLTGKVGMDRVFKPDEFRSNAGWNPWFKLENRKKVLDLLAGWKGLCEQYHCTVAQLVIAWTAAQSGVTHVLCGARTAQQAKENAGAGNVKLSPADLAKMRQDVEAMGKPQ